MLIRLLALFWLALSGLAQAAEPLDPEVAYLSSDQPVTSPFATCFEVLDVLDAGEKSLRAWVRDHQAEDPAAVSLLLAHLVGLANEVSDEVRDPDEQEFLLELVRDLEASFPS